MVSCAICAIVESKYRCTKCKLVRYCSKECYSQHMQVCLPPGSNNSHEQHCDAKGVPNTHDATDATNSTLREQFEKPLPQVLSNNQRLLQQRRSLKEAMDKNQIPDDQLNNLKQNPQLKLALMNPELQQIILGILEEHSEDIQHTILSHQIEFNHDFLEFINVMMASLDGYNELSDEAKLLDLLDEVTK